MLSRRFAVPIAALLVLAACSDAEQSTNSTAAAPTDNSPTTIDIAEQALAYSEYGDFPVGVTTLQLAKGPKVEIWYPAAAGTSGTETYDMRDFVGEGIRAILTGDTPSTYSYPAGRDALLADGSFPVVLFSHGVAGMRLQSSFLTSNLASWGMIVVSVDHPSRALENFLTGTATGDGGDSVDDMLRGLELITTLGADATSRFNGHVDAEKVAAVGHSAGGGTVLAAAADRRIDGYVSLASGVFRGGPAVEGATTTTAPLPGKPSFFIGGSVGALASFATLTQPAFEAAPSPSLLWEIEGAGHNVRRLLHLRQRHRHHRCGRSQRPRCAPRFDPTAALTWRGRMRATGHPGRHHVPDHQPRSHRLGAQPVRDRHRSRRPRRRRGRRLRHAGDDHQQVAVTSK